MYIHIYVYTGIDFLSINTDYLRKYNILFFINFVVIILKFFVFRWKDVFSILFSEAGYSSKVWYKHFDMKNQTTNKKLNSYYLLVMFGFWGNIYR